MRSGTPDVAQHPVPQSPPVASTEVSGRMTQASATEKCGLSKLGAPTCATGQPPTQAPTVLHPRPHGSHGHAVNALEVILQVQPGHPGRRDKDTVVGAPAPKGQHSLTATLGRSWAQATQVPVPTLRSPGTRQHEGDRAGGPGPPVPRTLRAPTCWSTRGHAPRRAPGDADGPRVPPGCWEPPGPVTAATPHGYVVDVTIWRACSRSLCT